MPQPARNPTPGLQVAAPGLALHAARGNAALRAECSTQLARVLPGQELLLLLCEGGADTHRVELALGPQPRARPGQLVQLGAVSHGAATTAPLRYQGEEIGRLLVFGAIDAAAEAQLADLLAHYAIAWVNQHLNSKALETTDIYCAALQALAEGIVLFQESDADVVAARFLTLAGGIVGTQYGALWLCEQIGTEATALSFAQGLGIPDDFVARLRRAGDQPWIGDAAARTLRVLAPDADGTWPELDSTLLPKGMRNLVVSPLRYHGVTAGLCVLLNADTEHSGFASRLESLRSFSELGAALFHRFALERESLRTKSLETQLRIAARIQEQLLPTRPPATPRLRFAWVSHPANHVGGDYLDLVEDPEGEIHAIVADVSGHGIDSALLMSSFRSAYRAGVGHKDLGPLLAELDAKIAREVGDTGMFLTVAALAFEPDVPRARFVGAGHIPVLHFVRRTGALREIVSAEAPLGLAADCAFRAEELELAAGDILLLHTDGVTEYWSRDNQEMFGDDRLRALLLRHAASGAETIKTKLLAALREFNDGVQHDDVSICVIEVV